MRDIQSLIFYEMAFWVRCCVSGPWMGTCAGYCHGRDPGRLFSSLAHDVCDKNCTVWVQMSSRNTVTRQTALSGGRRRGWVLALWLTQGKTHASTRTSDYPRCQPLYNLYLGIPSRRHWLPEPIPASVNKAWDRAKTGTKPRKYGVRC